MPPSPKERKFERFRLAQTRWFQRVRETALSLEPNLINLLHGWNNEQALGTMICSPVLSPDSGHHRRQSMAWQVALQCRISPGSPPNDGIVQSHCLIDGGVVAGGSATNKITVVVPIAKATPGLRSERQGMRRTQRCHEARPLLPSPSRPSSSVWRCGPVNGQLASP